MKKTALRKVNGKEIMPIMPDDMNYVQVPKALIYGFPQLKDQAKVLFLKLAGFDYICEPVYDEDGNEVGKTRKGYIYLSKASMCNRFNMVKSDLYKRLHELEECNLIVQESIDDTDHTAIKKIWFNYIPIIEENNRLIKEYEERGIHHNLKYIERPQTMTTSSQNLERVRVQDMENSPTDENDPSPTNNNSLSNENDPSFLNESPNNIKLLKKKSISNYVANVSTPSSIEARGINEIDLQEFVWVDTKSQIPEKPKKTSLKGYKKKIEAGDYGKITVNDLLEYFKDKYLYKYKMYYTIPTKDLPKTKSILGNGFLAKYGSKECINIIDILFEFYDLMDLKTQEYPRPTIISLTQDWLINKIKDFAYNKQRAKNEYKEDMNSPRNGPYDPMTEEELNNLNPEIVTTITKKDMHLFWHLARNGYISRDWLEDIDKLLENYPGVIEKWKQDQI